MLTKAMIPTGSLGGAIALTAVLMVGELRAQTPITFQYVYDDLGQLVRVIDSTGTVIEYAYDAAGNILEIKRSTVSGLAVYGFTPRQGSVGTKVTVQGQGFSTVPADNGVAFNGASAQVTMADANDLVVTVPASATTGRISVTVGGATGISDRDFIVLGGPVVTSVFPRLALAGTTIPGLAVSGANLAGASFHFEPQFMPPLLTVNTATASADGTSATLSVTIDPQAQGSFFPVATDSSDHSSSAVAVPGITLRVLDPDGDEDHDGLSNADELAHGTDPFNGDTDGDGFGDGDEVAAGSDPLDPNSLPVDPSRTVGEADGQPFSVLNTVDPSLPAPGMPPDPALFVGEAAGRPFSVLNTIDPSLPPPGQPPDPALFVGEASGRPFSVLNTVDPSLPPPGQPPDPALFVGEAEGYPFSVLNTIDPSLPAPGEPPDPALFVGEAVGPVFSVQNLAAQ